MTGPQLHHSAQSGLGTSAGSPTHSIGRSRAVFRWAAGAIGLGIAFLNGMNINDFGVNTSMARTRQVQQVSPEQQKAEEVANAFRTFMLTGNPDSKQTVLDAIQSPSPEFSRVFWPIFKQNLAGDLDVGPVIREFNAITGSINLNSLSALVDQVYIAISQCKSGQDGLAGLNTYVAATYGSNATAVYERVALQLILNSGNDAGVLTVDPVTTAAAQSDAAIFIRMMEAGSVIERNEWATQFTSAMNSRVVPGQTHLPSGYLKVFSETVKAKSSLMFNVLDVYANQNETPFSRLRPDQLADFCNNVCPILSQLRAEEYEFNRVQTAHGIALSAAVKSYVSGTKVPTRIITAADLTERLDALTAYLNSSGIDLSIPANLALKNKLDEWGRRVGAPGITPNTLVALDTEIPKVEEVMSQTHALEMRAARIAHMIDYEQAKSYGFYEVLGANVFVTRLEMFYEEINDYCAQTGGYGLFANAFAEKNRVTPAHVKSVLDAVRTANSQTVTDLDALASTIITEAGSSGSTPVMDLTDSTVTISENAMITTRTKINGYIDSMTNAIATYQNGLNGTAMVSGDSEWRKLRQTVACRFMAQFVVIEDSEKDDPSFDPVAKLLGNESGTVPGVYGELASNQNYLRFRSDFSTALLSYSGALASMPATTEGERYAKASRLDMVQRATALWPYLSLHSSFAFYEQLNAYYKGGVASNYGNQDEMARMCSLVVGFGGLPPAYAAFAYEKTGTLLLERYNDADIALIGAKVTAYSQIFIQGDYYFLLRNYLEVVDDKIKGIFPDIQAMRNTRMEGGGQDDNRIMTPAEAEYGQMFTPSAGFYIDLKSIYAASGSVYGVNVIGPAVVLDAPVAGPDLSVAKSRRFNKPMVEAVANIPSPFISAPLIVTADFGPDQYPPKGELLALMLSLDGNYEGSRTKTGTADGETLTRSRAGSGALDFSQQFEGLTTTGGIGGSASGSTIDQSDGTTLDGGGVVSGEAHVENRMTENWLTHTGWVGVDAIRGGTYGTDYLQTVGAYLSKTAPEGAEWLVYFQRTNDASGNVALTANIFHRWKNTSGVSSTPGTNTGGSFELCKTITLTPEQAESLYWEDFSDTRQRFHAEKRHEGERNTFIGNGTVMFMGTATDGMDPWPVIPQGVGAAWQHSLRNPDNGAIGGYLDWEFTRGQRGALGVGQFVPAQQRLWIGTVTLDLNQYPITTETTNEDGSVTTESIPTSNGRIYFEGRYTEMNRAQLEGFIGAGFRSNVGDMLSQDGQFGLLVNLMLGNDAPLQQVGGGGGRILRSSSDNTYLEQAYGGYAYGIGRSIYGVDRDLVLGSAVLSATGKKVTLTSPTEDTDATIETVTIPSTSLEITDAALTAAEFPGILTMSGSDLLSEAVAADTPLASSDQAVASHDFTLAAAYRRVFEKEYEPYRSLEAGLTSTFDMLADRAFEGGGGFMDWEWKPEGNHFTGGTFTLALLSVPTDSGNIPVPIAGATTDWINKKSGNRYKADIWIPGLGEYRLFTPNLDVEAGGYYIVNTARGANLGFSFPFGTDNTWNLTLLGGASQTFADFSGGAGTYQFESGNILTHFNEAGTGSHYAWFSGIYQHANESDQSAVQLDLHVGGASATTTSSSSINLLAQSWWNWVPEEDSRSRQLSVGLQASRYTLGKGFKLPFTKTDVHDATGALAFTLGNESQLTGNQTDFTKSEHFVFTVTGMSTLTW